MFTSMCRKWKMMCTCEARHTTYRCNVNPLCDQIYDYLYYDTILLEILLVQSTYAKIGMSYFVSWAWPSTQIKRRRNLFCNVSMCGGEVVPPNGSIDWGNEMWKKQWPPKLGNIGMGISFTFQPSNLGEWSSHACLACDMALTPDSVACRKATKAETCSMYTTWPQHCPSYQVLGLGCLLMWVYFQMVVTNWKLPHQAKHLLNWKATCAQVVCICLDIKYIRPHQLKTSMHQQLKELVIEL